MQEVEKPKEVSTSPLMRIGIASFFVVLAACAILFASRAHYLQSPVVSPEENQTTPSSTKDSEELD